MTAAVAPPVVPLALRLAGHKVVGVGGGRVAAAKLLPLAAAGAELHVVAPTVQADLASVATCHRRPYAGAADLQGALLVVAATDDATVNDRVAGDAAAATTLCVRSDAGGQGSADLPAVVRRGAVTLAVSSGVPALSRWLSDQLAGLWGDELGTTAELLAEVRADPAVRARLASIDPVARRAAWRAIPVADILRLVRNGDVVSAKRAALECLSSSWD